MGVDTVKPLLGIMENSVYILYAPEDLNQQYIVISKNALASNNSCLNLQHSIQRLNSIDLDRFWHRNDAYRLALVNLLQ